MKKIRRNITMIILISFIGIILASCNRAELTDETKDLDVVENLEESEVLDDALYVSKLEKIGEAIVQSDNKSPQEILSNAYTNYGDIVENIYYADDHGKMTLSSPLQLPEDYDARKRPWYKKALEKNIYLPEPYEDASTHKNIQTISKAIYKEGELIGVVALDYEVEGISSDEEKKPETKPQEAEKTEQNLSEKEKEELHKFISEIKQVVESEKDLDTLKEHFNQTIEENTFIQTIYLANKEEIFLITPYVQLPDTYNPSIRPWYESAIKEGFYISMIYTDASNNKALVTVSTKVELVDEAVAVLAIDYQIN